LSAIESAFWSITESRRPAFLGGIMKRSVLLLALAVATAAAAQQPQDAQSNVPEVKKTNISASITARQQAPSYSDVYCAGFISNQPLHKVGYVAGGWDTPHQVRYTDREYVYLEGSGFSVGGQYSIARELRDPNRYEDFSGQFSMLRQVGKPYADVGRVRVIAIEKNIAISQVEFNCGDIMNGDAAIAFAERQIPALRGKIKFDRFAPPNGKLTGKIVMTKDFDSMAGMGRKVYLNVGANQGVKSGDYFRAVRTYDSYSRAVIDNLSFAADYYDDSQVPEGSFPYSRLHQLPRISLGEMVVLGVTPTSSTAMITLSLQDIHVGDGVELEEVPAEASSAEPVVQQVASSLPEQAPVQTEQAPAAAPKAPVVACLAEPAAVHAGESSTISCEASSPDNRPLSFSFNSPNAPLVQRGNTAVLDTKDLAAGPVQVMATVSDDRDMIATSTTTVNVAAARASLAPAKLNYISFKRNTARLDNAGKAVLDGVALRLERDSDNSLVVVGLTDSGESKALAQKRAANAAEYLTKDKGIDQKRVQIQDGGEYGNKAEFWMVPPGSKLQEADLKH
jgi:outer membrane protein OmpA-like peptidoglycan-associated protein